MCVGSRDSFAFTYKKIAVIQPTPLRIDNTLLCNILMVQAFFLNSFKEPSCRLYGHKSARFFFLWHSSYTNTQFETDTYLSKFASSWCVYIHTASYNKVQDLFTQIYRWTTAKKLCTRVSLVKRAVSFFVYILLSNAFFCLGGCLWGIFYMSANKGYIWKQIFFF